MPPTGGHRKVLNSLVRLSPALVDNPEVVPGHRVAVLQGLPEIGLRRVQVAPIQGINARLHGRAAGKECNEQREYQLHG
jgi:hypothetical protein